MALVPLAAAAPAGAHHSVDGTLRGLHADYFDAGSSATRWQVDTGTETVDVLPTTLPALTPEHAAVAVEDKDPGAGVAGPVTAAAPQAAPVLGGRKTAVIAFNFADNPVEPWTLADIEGRIFTDPDSTSAFFAEESYDQLWLTGKAGNVDGDVYGWYTLPAPTTCTAPYYPEVNAWATAATDQATDIDGFDAAGYDHVMYVFPPQPVCKWAGLAYMPGTESWINGDLSVRVTAHELGHNLGLHHAGAWFCKNRSNRAVTISSNCTVNEYNDPFDVMGNWGGRHSHGWHLQQLGLLQASNVETVTESGTYSVASALDPTTDPTSLRIPRTYSADGSVQNWYDVEIREAGGVFESFPGLLGSAVTGVSIRAVDDPLQLTVSRLLDTDPGGYVSDAPLDAGKTFSDGRISVTTLSAGGGAASVAINMSAPPLDQDEPSAPTGLSHVRAGAGLRVSWDGSDDDVGVSAYPVYRDGVQVGSASSSSYDDATVLPGRHVYTVYAEDAAGNRSAASDPYVVTVAAAKASKASTRSADRTGPNLRLARKRLRGSRLLLTASARDKAGVARVELRVDGRRVIARRASRLSYRWRLRPGRHRFVAVAVDKRGNRSVHQLSLRVPHA